MMNIKYKRFILLSLYLIIFFYSGCSEKNTTLSPIEPGINTNPTFTLQGFNICAWGKDWWSDDALVDEALRFAIEEGSNFIALDWPVNFYDNGKIVPLDTSIRLHPYWDDIKKVVNKAKAKGFFIMLKPYVTLANSAENRNFWNTDINIFKLSNFFPDYKKYPTQLAEFATQNNVNAICIGTESSHIDWLFRDDWIDLINAVRAKFNGALTYDALFNRWYYQDKDIDEVVFRDQLDFIGVSLYVPITTDDNASVDTLKQGWFVDLGEWFGGWFEIDNVIEYLGNISNRYNKQIMALEGGYPSVNGGLYLANAYPSEDKYAHYDLQSRGLDAYLDVLKSNKENWFKGVSLWQLTPYMMRQETLTSIYHTQ